MDQHKRIFRHTAVNILNQETYEIVITMLFDQLLNTGRHYDLIIGISSGGDRIAIDLSEKLKCPYSLIRAKHNKTNNIYTVDTGNVVVDVPVGITNLDNKDVFIVDDIIGSGSTISSVLKVLKNTAGLSRYAVFSICLNEGSELEPEFYFWKVSDWVIFPWEDQVANVSTNELSNPTIQWKS